MLLWILSYLYPNPSFLVDSGCQETVTGDFEETATGDFEVVLTLRQKEQQQELERLQGED